MKSEKLLRRIDDVYLIDSTGNIGGANGAIKIAGATVTFITNTGNINGTGRSVEFLINTSENNRAFTLSTTEKFFLNNKVNHKYSSIYTGINSYIVSCNWNYILFIF